ncbi:hypothetical protein [Roseateles terrae]|uniref:Chromosome segregation and condensation protein ScpB n=1 Tax=Roseateles terrae TaxID=431060 RepID=A0ABR6GQK1_9BURK|nr:hypothetical protein [Roseateles terrae]MBB3193962.1 chromosome segregation and condensation protein ScpB [Roseateles terrae]OWQ87838.1 hypothetical protein CDN98_06645 [Roseateles terrae]
MKRDTAETSIRAYYEIAQADLSASERKVLHAMAVGQLYTRRQLEVLTGFRSGPVCGRVHALIEKGLIEVVGEKLCPESGRPVEALRLVAQQLELALT